ncbi:fibronectin type III domain protein [Jatrophihabitans sp. GAS493]|nr:fibronectin type III domain protein [Jatrophihabitans sp. GAS493]
MHAPVATVNGTAIDLTWTSGNDNGGANGSVVTGYTVQFASGDNGTACTTNGAAMGCTVTGLATDTDYTFTVTATNAKGTSPLSPVSNVARIGSTGTGGGGGTCTSTSADGCGSVIVDGSISISLDNADSSFALGGQSGTDSSTPDNTISYVVTTNNAAGYSVSVKSDQPTLTPDSAKNSDKISFDAITATGTAFVSGTIPNDGTSDGGSAQLATGGTVYTQTARSKATGDTHTTTFGVNIPFVAADAYRGTVTFTASAN